MLGCWCDRIFSFVQRAAMDTKKRKNLDVTMKLDIIRRVEQGEKESSVVDAFGITRNTLSTLLRNKADIKANAAEQSRSGARGVRIPAFENNEKELYARLSCK